MAHLMDKYINTRSIWPERPHKLQSIPCLPTVHATDPSAREVCAKRNTCVKTARGLRLQVVIQMSVKLKPLKMAKYITL